MTASRYKVPKGFLDVAGQRLGLNLVDLFGNDDKGKANLEGFEPVYNAQTQFTSKGRGGVLSYKTPKVPTTTYTSEFSLIPERKEAAPAGPTGPTTKGYNWNAYGNLGGPGYGAKDLEKALAEGFSEQDVKNYLQQNKQLFGAGRLNLAEDLQKKFGFDYSYVNPEVQADVVAGKYGSPASLIRMADPKKFADSRQNQEFMKAENVSPITAGISTKYGMNSQYFGAEDLKAARDQGFTNLQIKDYLDKNPSLLREQNVKGGGGLYDELAKSLSPTTAKATTTPTTATIPTTAATKPTTATPTTATSTTATPTTTTGGTTARQAKVLDVNRFFNTDLGKHFYSSDPDEQSPGGYTKEGLGFKLFDDSDATEGASDVFRLYHPDQRDHLYTTNKAEVESAQRGGYKLEKTIGEAYTTEREGTTPVFRFASPTGKHFYTSDQNEVNSLGNLGYKSEGTAFYSPRTTAATTATTTAAESKPIFENLLQTQEFRAAESKPIFENSLQTQEFRAAPEKFEETRRLSTEYGMDATYFGKEDLDAARRQGISDREIKDFLDKNIAGLLREGNLPGKGGVYDQLIL